MNKLLTASGELLSLVGSRMSTFLIIVMMMGGGRSGDDYVAVVRRGEG